MDRPFDLIAIGDSVSDEFIELKDVRIDTDKDPGDKGYDEICFRFGDKVEYESVNMVYAVGNAANAAVAAARLGLKTGFVTDIGDDDLGKKKVESLKGNKVDCRWVEIHNNMPSNHHYVLRKNAERTILIKHHEYPYKIPEDLEMPAWFYFSSAGTHDPAYYVDFIEWLTQHPGSRMAFQPGTLQIDLGYEKLQPMYERADIFFCNKEESRRILNNDEQDITKQLSALRALGPKMVVITDGTKGAYADDGGNAWLMPMYPDPKPPVDRTGTGDAFSSTFTIATALGEPIERALLWAPINAMSVAQYIGAQEGLLTRERLEKYLADAPKEYTPKKIA